MFDTHQLNRHDMYNVVGRYFDTDIYVLGGGADSVIYKTARDTAVVTTSISLNPLKHYLYELWGLAKSPAVVLDNCLMTEMVLMRNVREAGDSYREAREFINAMRDAFFAGADGLFYIDDPYKSRYLDMKKFVRSIPENYKNMFSVISPDWFDWSDDLMIRNILEYGGVMYPVDCFRALNDRWVGNLRKVNYEHYI